VSSQTEIINPLMGTSKPHNNGPLYSNTVIGTLAVDGWAVTFGTARMGLGGLPTSYYSMWDYNYRCPLLEGSMEGTRYQGKPKRQWINDIEDWTGYKYIQLKEMSVDREQWRKTREWSAAVANPRRRKSDYRQRD